MDKPKRKYFTIHENDAGSEAYCDDYVQHLEHEVERLREEVRCLSLETWDGMRAQLTAADAVCEHYDDPPVCIDQFWSDVKGRALLAAWRAAKEA